MRKKLLIAYAVFILIFTSVIGTYVVHTGQSEAQSEYETHILEKTLMAATLLTEAENTTAAVHLSEKLGDTLPLRITLVDANGTVRYDSSTPASQMENHKNRPEIATALSGKTTTLLRHSHTHKERYLYAAAPVSISGERFAIRLSVPASVLSPIKRQLLLTVLLIAFPCALSGFGFALYFSRRISRPLHRLTEAVVEISHGNYQNRIPAQNKDELFALTDAFHQMADTLHQTIHQLEQENQKMEAIVNSMINGIVAIDNQSKILMINRMCLSLFDIRYQNLLGRDFYDIFRNETLYRILETSVQERRYAVEEFIVKSPFRSEKTLRVYVSPIKGVNKGDPPLGTLLLFQDMTQMRKLEQFRRDFISNVTHELKTPLTSIMGFTDTLAAGAIYDTDAAKRFLEIIGIETRRLYRLIQDILSLSEIETQKAEDTRTPSMLTDILGSVEKLLRPQAEEKGLALNIIVEENIPPYPCNRDRIAQMCINLIENAIKYTETGSVTVTCQKEEEILVLSIQDTGIGIPQESIDRIFERFYRVDKGRSRKAGGTGLGLSIVKHITMLYDGWIKVDSREGEGSTFTVYLPYPHAEYKV